jgi:hypothetical protein
MHDFDIQQVCWYVYQLKNKALGFLIPYIIYGFSFFFSFFGGEGVVVVMVFPVEYSVF